MRESRRDHGASAGGVYWLLRAAHYTDTERPPGEHVPGAAGSSQAAGAIRGETLGSLLASWVAQPLYPFLPGMHTLSSLPFLIPVREERWKIPPNWRADGVFPSSTAGLTAGHHLFFRPMSRSPMGKTMVARPTHARISPVAGTVGHRRERRADHDKLERAYHTQRLLSSLAKPSSMAPLPNPKQGTAFHPLGGIAGDEKPDFL